MQTFKAFKKKSSDLWLEEVRNLPLKSVFKTKIYGDCMKPHVSSGSMIAVQRKNFAWPGDIIVLAKPDGRFLCHRFLGYALSPKGIVIVSKGDHADSVDPPSNATSMLGTASLPILPKTRIKSVFVYFRTLGEIVIDKCRHTIS